MWLLAADVAPEAAASGGGLVAVLVAVAGTLGVIATAVAPALTERMKRPSSPAPAAPAPPAGPPPTGAPVSPPTTPTATLSVGASDRDADVFDALEESIRDLRAQRDAAQAEVARVSRETGARIDQLREELSEARIAIARLQAGRYSG
jgi:hypothetical protein